MDPSKIRVDRDNITCHNATINSYPVFYAETGNIRLIARQPSPQDRGAILQAESRTGTLTMQRYTQRYAKRITPRTSLSFTRGQVGHPRKAKRFMICDLPPFKSLPGTLHMIMELDREVIGFARLDFNFCENVNEVYGFTSENKGEIVEDTSMMIIDPYQRRGLGTVFARLNEFIDKEFGVEWISGTTWIKGGLLNIRLYDGWSVVNMLVDHNQAVIRKRLKP